MFEYESNFEREEYENDLEEFSNREAFEDMIAERDELFWDEDDDEWIEEDD
jgi:hypothetical protein